MSVDYTNAAWHPDTTSNIPIFRQLVHHFRNQIHLGILVPGTQLPPQRAVVGIRGRLWLPPPPRGDRRAHSRPRRPGATRERAESGGRAAGVASDLPRVAASGRYGGARGALLFADPGGVANGRSPGLARPS